MMIKKLGYMNILVGWVWKTLFGSCMSSENVHVAKSLEAANVMELDGDKEYTYVIMSNVYVWQGKWEDVRAMKKTMKEYGKKLVVVGQIWSGQA